MKEKEKNKQQIYRVRVYKDFDFPSFSINKVNRLEDIVHNSIEELKENFQKRDYLQFEIINILPFSLKTNISDITTNNTDYDFFVKEIALQSTEDKYGKLSFEENPDIFEKRDVTDTSVTFNLKSEVEQYFVDRIKKYSQTIKDKKVLRENFI